MDKSRGREAQLCERVIFPQHAHERQRRDQTYGTADQYRLRAVKLRRRGPLPTAANPRARRWDLRCGQRTRGADPVLQRLPGSADAPACARRGQPGGRALGRGRGVLAASGGNFEIHRSLEKAIADSRGTRRACCSAPATSPTPGSSPHSPAGRGDPLRRAQSASIIDGCRQSRARTIVYTTAISPRSPDRLISFDGHRLLIVTDAVFSMGGDTLRLRASSRCFVATARGYSSTRRPPPECSDRAAEDS